MERKEPRIYHFEDRLVVKLIGKAEWIKQHIISLRKLYSAERMNYSPILKNRGEDNTYHCFVNILMKDTGGSEQ